uniref:Uncharacterized protein n=1 Tax=Tetranychus urticae TaxID=32264 RepID=T1JPY8_TETUR
MQQITPPFNQIFDWKIYLYLMVISY